MNILNVFQQLGAFSLFGGVLAAVATVLAYVFIIPENAGKSSTLLASFSMIPAISSI